MSTLPHLRDLYLGGIAIGYGEVAILRQLPSLREVTCAKCPIVEGCLEGLPDGLTSLHLSRASLTDDCLIGLPAHISVLSMADTLVGDKAMTHIGGLENLTWLDLSNTRVTDVGVQSISGLPRLKFLLLGGTQVSANGVAVFHDRRDGLPAVTVYR